MLILFFSKYFKVDEDGLKVYAKTDDFISLLLKELQLPVSANLEEGRTFEEISSEYQSKSTGTK